MLGWAAVLVVAVLVSYQPSWRIPLLFDDLESVTLNSSLRPPWQWADLLSPPASVPTKGRPLANLSFALSYRLSAAEPWGYHALNLAFHLVTVLALFGVVRRTLVRCWPGDSARALRGAGGAALLWAVHPALVQTVSYISQRTELMLGAFALLTLLGFVRWVHGGARGWAVGSVVAAFLGALCKEGFVAVPLVILAYDGIFVAGSVRAAWRARRLYYVTLAGVWPLVLSLLADVGARGVGTGQGITVLDYARTQVKAWVVYLQLVVWPHPLVFDRGFVLVRSWGDALPYLLLVGAMLVGAAWLVRRWLAAGFLLAAFALLLAPASSVVPVAGATIAENRLYLPSALVVVGLVVAATIWLQPRRWWGLVGGLTLLASVATVERNRTFQDAVGLWRQTLVRAPENFRAYNNLGELLNADPGRRAEARRCFEAALRLKPDYAPAHQNLGILRARQPDGREEGIAHLQEALRLDPGLAAAHSNLGGLLARIAGREAEAMRHHDAAVRLDPRVAAVWYNRGNTLARDPGRWTEALADFARALELDPTMAEAHANRASLLLRLPGREAEAMRHHDDAVRFNPQLAEAWFNRGNALARDPARWADALRDFSRALVLDPALVEAYANRGALWAKLPGQAAAAEADFAAALRLKPDYAEVQLAWADLLAARAGQRDEAQRRYELALRIRPDLVAAHFGLGNLLAAAPDGAAAAQAHFEAALRLNPALFEAQANLAALLERDPARSAEALRHHRRAVELAPDNAIVHFNLAAGLERAGGAAAEAREHYARALRLNPDLEPARQALQRLGP